MTRLQTIDAALARHTADFEQAIRELPPMPMEQRHDALHTLGESYRELTEPLRKERAGIVEGAAT